MNAGKSKICTVGQQSTVCWRISSFSEKLVFFILFSPSFDWIKPPHIMKAKLFYSELISLNVNLILQHPSYWHRKLTVLLTYFFRSVLICHLLRQNFSNAPVQNLHHFLSSIYWPHFTFLHGFYWHWNYTIYLLCAFPLSPFLEHQYYSIIWHSFMEYKQLFLLTILVLIFIFT